MSARPLQSMRRAAAARGSASSSAADPTRAIAPSTARTAVGPRAAPSTMAASATTSKLPGSVDTCFESTRKASQGPFDRGYNTAVSLFDDVAAGKLAPVYILCSTEPLLLDRALAAIREAAVPAPLRAFNEDVIDGRGATAARILGAARTLPMMAARRLVLVRDLGQVPAAELAELATYMEAPGPETVLVATCAKVDRRLKFFAAAGKSGYLHELAPPRDLGGWLAEEARRSGVAI